MYLPAGLLGLIEASASAWDWWGGEALGGLGLGSSSPCTLTSVTPSARTPVMESESQHCPQLEALQEQLQLLEEENEQRREEVRTGEEGVLLGRGY